MSETIGPDFLRGTAYLAGVMPSSPQQLGVPQPPLELPVPADTPRIPLPKPADIQTPTIDLLTAINRRRTARSYSKQALSLDELSFLLWCTQGVEAITDRPAMARTVPSAGARHAFETYLLINNVDGIEAGLYRFIGSEHSLIKLNTKSNLVPQIKKACREQQQFVDCAVAFFWVAVTERMTWRYPGRGYRYLFIDAGHVCQNLYLAAEAINSGVCAVAAYNDDEINETLGLDGQKLWVIYIATLGKKG